jgi:hypothetical protein
VNDVLNEFECQLNCGVRSHITMEQLRDLQVTFSFCGERVLMVAKPVNVPYHTASGIS